MEPGKFSITDEDSKVQTARGNFRVKNIPKDPFSHIAKPTPIFSFGFQDCFYKYLANK